MRGASVLAASGVGLVCGFLIAAGGPARADVQAGMKAWTRAAADAINFASDNYSYEVEIPVNALKKGLRVVDVPITTDARQGGHTNVNVVFDGIKLLRDITRFRLTRT